MEVTPNEDLMREHGLLNRILIIYEKIIAGRNFRGDLVYTCAQMIRKFIEDYHEKIEEKYVFPVLVTHGKHVDQISQLLEQHKLGRRITSEIIDISRDRRYKNRTIELMQTFIYMYRIHETIEDTVIFESFRELLSKREYLEMGEVFEEKEYEIIGKNGFSDMLKKVENIEKELDISLLEVTKYVKHKI